MCARKRCSCFKSHNTQAQPLNITTRLFNQFIESHKLPLKELLMKLNKVYYDQIIKIIDVIQNRPDYFAHEYFSIPNGRNTITELEKIFKLIENSNSTQISSIYSRHLSQLDYSLLYETFRRSKQCSNFKNGKSNKEKVEKSNKHKNMNMDF